MLACSFKLQKIIDFEKALCFPLSPVPLSVANPDGSPRKTTKSQLNKILIANYDFKKPPPDKGSVKCYIIDTIAANRCIATVPETYEDLAWSLIKMVPKNYPRVDIVADTCHNSSLKNQERNTRGISEKVMISSSKSKIPRDFTNVLANNDNKNNMILTIFKDNRAKTLNVLKTNELISSADEQCFKITLTGVYALDELLSNQEEADAKVTLYSYSILKNINPERYVIIRSHSDDIDINIIATSLLFTYSANVYIDYGNSNSRKGIYLSELNITNSEKELFLGMHAFSGNDFMSSFFHKSQVQCWKIM